MDKDIKKFSTSPGGGEKEPYRLKAKKVVGTVTSLTAAVGTLVAFVVDNLKGDVPNCARNLEELIRSHLLNQAQEEHPLTVEQQKAIEASLIALLRDTSGSVQNHSASAEHWEALQKSGLGKVPTIEMEFGSEERVSDGRRPLSQVPLPDLERTEPYTNLEAVLEKVLQIFIEQFDEDKNGELTPGEIQDLAMAVIESDLLTDYPFGDKNPEEQKKAVKDLIDEMRKAGIKIFSLNHAQVNPTARDIEHALDGAFGVKSPEKIGESFLAEIQARYEAMIEEEVGPNWEEKYPRLFNALRNLNSTVGRGGIIVLGILLALWVGLRRYEKSGAYQNKRAVEDLLKENSEWEKKRTEIIDTLRRFESYKEFISNLTRAIKTAKPEFENRYPHEEDLNGKKAELDRVTADLDDLWGKMTSVEQNVAAEIALCRADPPGSTDIEGWQRLVEAIDTAHPTLQAFEKEENPEEKVNSAKPNVLIAEIRRLIEDKERDKESLQGLLKAAKKVKAMLEKWNFQPARITNTQVNELGEEGMANLQPKIGSEGLRDLFEQVGDFAKAVASFGESIKQYEAALAAITVPEAIDENQLSLADWHKRVSEVVDGVSVNQNGAAKQEIEQSNTSLWETHAALKRALGEKEQEVQEIWAGHVERIQSPLSADRSLKFDLEAIPNPVLTEVVRNLFWQTWNMGLQNQRALGRGLGLGESQRKGEILIAGEGEPLNDDALVGISSFLEKLGFLPFPLRQGEALKSKKEEVYQHATSIKGFIMHPHTTLARNEGAIEPGESTISIPVLNQILSFLVDARLRRILQASNFDTTGQFGIQVNFPGSSHPHLAKESLVDLPMTQMSEVGDFNFDGSDVTMVMPDNALVKLAELMNVREGEIYLDIMEMIRKLTHVIPLQGNIGLKVIKDQEAQTEKNMSLETCIHAAGITALHKALQIAGGRESAFEHLLYGKDQLGQTMTAEGDIPVYIEPGTPLYTHDPKKENRQNKADVIRHEVIIGSLNNLWRVKDLAMEMQFWPKNLLDPNSPEDWFHLLYATLHYVTFRAGNTPNARYAVMADTIIGSDGHLLTNSDLESSSK